MNSTTSSSPTLTWSKFLTSGPAVTSKVLPAAVFSVTLRVALSMAITDAEALTVSATATLPGWLDVTTAAVGACWASTGSASTDVATATERRDLRMMGFLKIRKLGNWPTPARDARALP